MSERLRPEEIPNTASRTGSTSEKGDGIERY